MNRSPYSSYHGRGSWLRRVLVVIVILLVIALAVAVVGLFVLPNYIVYTPNGPQLVIPFFNGSQPSQAPSPSPTRAVEASPSQTPGDIIIEPLPSPSAKPSPSRDPEPLPERRAAPLGLVPYEEGKTLPANQGFLFTAQQVEDFTRATCREDYGYVAVYLDAGGLDQETLAETCLDLADKAVDELVINGEVDWPALREALPESYFHGYLSAVAGKSPFQDDTQQGRDMAKYCDRVYVPGGNWNGLNLYRYLKDNEFKGTTADIVTTVTKPLSTNYAWAVLPSQAD